MTPAKFVAKWHNNELSERAGAQTHFLDLCDLLGVDKPSDPDNYCFERGASRTGAGHGWADVWKRGCFAWESKAPGKNLAGALKQLMTYALALDNPPLLVVSDREIIQIHTHFTGTPSEVHTIHLQDIGLPENLAKLRALFDNPDRFRPARTTFAVTEEAAGRMGAVAKRLTERGNDPQAVAHFLIQCVFCMFSEDAGILPEKLFESVLDKSNPDGRKAQSKLALLFDVMTKGGAFGADDIPWFNGGLFKDVAVPALETADVVELLAAARMNWGAIEPAILGTLFERGLNPDMRSQLGAHYTDPDTIMKLVRPVVIEPLEHEWAAIHAQLETLAPKFGYTGSKKRAHPNAERREGQALFNSYLERLKNYRVLDPACGSGNFLYLSLKALKDMEHRANLEAEVLGLQRQVSIEASPANVLGIELNPYAAELARVTVWIGEIQWMLAHGYRYREKPILAPLDHIERGDAVLNADGTEPNWPVCDAIVGNPPFLGGNMMRGELGGAYVESLRNRYDGRIPGGADLVTYWFGKALTHIEEGKCQRAGLVGTNSIRGGTNRKVLERIVAGPGIFEAWSDEPWVNNGASVRVSLVAFGPGDQLHLDGQPVANIEADLTTVDMTAARRLPENAGISFQGPVLVGPFEVEGDIARDWLKLPNPNGRPNWDVVRPLTNGRDITDRSRGLCVVDFSCMTEGVASLYEQPFEYVRQHVKPLRDMNADESRRNRWWLHGRLGTEWRRAISPLARYIATTRVAKHRTFVWFPTVYWPSDAVVGIARSDDTTFGILHSRIHELWSLKMCTWLGVGNDPRYTPTTTFETFPFPDGLTPNLPPESYTNPQAEAIACATKRLNELRENWLNPPEWVDWVRTPEEERAGFPARPVAKPGHEIELRQRTLTNLYNQRPTWLDQAHKTLDTAVATAYAWNDYTPETPDQEILQRLLQLNLGRG